MFLFKEKKNWMHKWAQCLNYFGKICINFTQDSRRLMEFRFHAPFSIDQVVAQIQIQAIGNFIVHLEMNVLCMKRI